ncbi:hypothetical protein ACRS85_17335 [Pluralibacter gergoviae]|uniref:hypothetical protein n=1 Tax=Pluralibacter gergoviae TaxID=61647 RepID=UPI003EDF1606
MQSDISKKAAAFACGDRIVKLGDASLREECLALIAMPEMPLSLALYATGILIGKVNYGAQSGDIGEMLLYAMSQQLRLLAEEGELQRLFDALPPVLANRQAALRSMTAIARHLGLPAAQEAALLEEAAGQLTADPALAPRFRAFITARLDGLFSRSDMRHADRFLMTATTWFRISMLSATWFKTRGTLAPGELDNLMAALGDWEAKHPANLPAAGRADDTLLYALSLL